MKLLVDIGNTRVKWAWLNDGELSFGAPVVHRGQALASVWSALWRGHPAPVRVVVACVAGDAVVDSLNAWSHEHWGVQPEFVAAVAEACGVSNGYRQPLQLGVDRWLALIGARQMHEVEGQSLCVVGCGTALTVDVLAVDGRHLGGWIAPGLALMRQQLVGGTAALGAAMEPAASIDGFGHGTAEAVAAGVRHAAAGLVMQALPVAQRLLGHPPVCVLTGGDADPLSPLLPPGTLVVPDLVLHGLAALVQQGATL